MVQIKRKVVQHGPSTLIVSLPSSWTKKYEISKGSEVEVQEDEGRIIISKDDSQKPTEVEIDITGLDRTSIMYAIRSLYRLGYDVVHVKFDNPVVYYQRSGKNLSVLSVIHSEVNRLVGYEIIQEREKSCVIKDLQDTSMRDFDQILRRVFLLLVDTSKDFLEGAKSNNIILLETIEQKHDTITKFISYCLRLLNKKGYPVPKKTAYYYHIIANLDRVTDIIKYAARDLRGYGKKPKLLIIELLELIIRDLGLYYEFFYNYNNKKISNMNNSRYEIERALRTLPNNIKTAEMIVVTSMFQILEVILDLIEARTALEY